MVISTRQKLVLKIFDADAYDAYDETIIRISKSFRWMENLCFKEYLVNGKGDVDKGEKLPILDSSEK
ncbi:2659_t:CDS:2 [Funneliformis caledonium]|uniref:2659_t:CDS:1 n=1 Tax=Funneliformis caledonium TaxID=1117310 RepID=A0A9N9AZU4_9GLOM|nr:2659_t:CDS:2 [Funneliformis caledonium]